MSKCAAISKIAVRKSRKPNIKDLEEQIDQQEEGKVSNISREYQFKV